jgi:hypothetical protein
MTAIAAANLAMSPESGRQDHCKHRREPRRPGHRCQQPNVLLTRSRQNSAAPARWRRGRCLSCSMSWLNWAARSGVLISGNGPSGLRSKPYGQSRKPTLTGLSECMPLCSTTAGGTGKPPSSSSLRSSLLARSSTGACPPREDQSHRDAPFARHRCGKRPASFESVRLSP